MSNTQPWPIGRPLTMPAEEALKLAKHPHMNRFVRCDFGWVPIAKKDLVALLERTRPEVAVNVQKEHHFSIFYFTIDRP